MRSIRNSSWRGHAAFVFACAFVLAVAAPAAAQIATGNIYGTVKDESGSVLPGAQVTLSGDSGTSSTTSGAQGEFRFVSLNNGNYELSVALDGFAAVSRRVVVVTGANVDLAFILAVAAMEETLTVTAETPTVDSKKLGTNTTLSRAELQRIPQARDPWAVLRTIPGIIVDRVNIAGNESGQQANFQAKGADDLDITWNLDGIQIDDMAAAGASPTYYDYDAFDEMAVTTGGNDLQVQTGAVGLNFVTKRGTNRWRGSARGLLTHDDLQWSNIAGTELEGDPRLGGADKADHIDKIYDYGLELGGPLIKDKLFVWGAYGKQDITLVRTNQTFDQTILEGYNAKLNWSVNDSTQASVFFFNGVKVKNGRDPGQGLQWDDSALWDQGPFYADFWSPHGLLKVELSHVFNPNFFVTAKYANYDTGFTLASRDLSTASHLDLGAGRGLGGAWVDVRIQRPLKNLTNVDGNYFASAFGGQHELKFGFGYKKAPVTSQTIYGGDDGLVAWSIPGFSYVAVYRPGFLSLEGEFFSAYLGDTFTKDRLTIKAGVRYDHQVAENLGATIPGSSLLPSALPELVWDGSGAQGITWSNFSPRIGLTYALDEDSKTVLRGSFAQYASKLDTLSTTFDNPLGAAYLAYYWNDVNGDSVPQRNEVDVDTGYLWYAGFDPADPTATTSVNGIDPDYKAPTDLEVVVGLDRELLPDLALSAAYTWRRNRDQRNWNPRPGLTTADYSSLGLTTANGYSAEAFAPDPAKVAAAAGGRIKTNRPDYYQTYNGVELSLIKRLSNRWMARLAFSAQSHKEFYDGPGAVQSPQRTDISGGTAFDGSFGGPQVDGGAYAPRSGGSGKGDAFYGANWQLSANALYELPAGFEIAGAVYGRQGLMRPIVLTLVSGADGRVRTLAVDTLDELRYPSLWNVDLRLAKNFSFGDNGALALSAELFNVFNSPTELNRYRYATGSAFNRLDEVLSPRILRFGARLSF